MLPCLIGRVKDTFGALSNMSAHEVEFAGKCWPRAEHLFQALRFAPDDPMREEIRALLNPMTAKMHAKAHTARMMIGRGTVADVDNMRFVLRTKLAQHAAVRLVLASTGARSIIEDCSRRASASGLFWGAVLREDRLGIKIWHGENWLGRLWTELRDEGATGGAKY